MLAGSSKEQSTGELYEKTSRIVILTNCVKTTGSTLKRIITQSSTNQISLSNDFLNINFDSTGNDFNPTSCLVESNNDNEVHAHSKMKKQPDRPHFEQAMFEEVRAIFDNEIWEVVHRSEMLKHCKKLESEGKEVQRK